MRFTGRERTMSIIDIAIIAVFVTVLLMGLYNGFCHTGLSFAAIILSIILAFMFMGLGSNKLKDNEKLYNMMLYYTEGSEFINDSELAKRSIYTFTTEEIDEIIEGAELPYPMDKEIRRNIMKEAFSEQGIITLGEYFNSTMVNVFINIVVFLVFYLVFRVLFAVGINWYDYAVGLPGLRAYDALFALAASCIRGLLVLVVIFTLVPIVLTFLGQISFIKDMLNESKLVHLLYESNFILSWMPST